MVVQLKRVYDEPSDDDGLRVLVDRLWPRGLTKEHAHVDLWARDVAPSTGLRQTYHRDGLPFGAFAERYREELRTNPALDDLRAVVADHPTVTLLYGARDTHDNHAVVLRDDLAGTTHDEEDA